MNKELKTNLIIFAVFLFGFIIGSSTTTTIYVKDDNDNYTQGYHAAMEQFSNDHNECPFGGINLEKSGLTKLE
jgi:uncharacterized membrane protein